MSLLKSILSVSENFNSAIYKNIFSRNRHFLNNMECIDLHPPQAIIGMTELNRNIFRKIIQIPQLKILANKSHKILPILKKHVLKMEHLKPVFDNDNSDGEKIILLHPLAVKNWESLPIAELEKYDISSANFFFGNLELGYENWRADEILNIILGKENERLTSYSRVGHLVHVNLRDNLLPYKKIIGEILKDKIVGCKTVVNKTKNIDNTYRNFQLELICGEPNYEVETKENGVTFAMDFSKVYWNPRLSTEHERITNLLQPNDVLYDIFAGVGPFAVPAAKKKCFVLANDLNPDSFKWLNHNIKKNKCIDYIKTFNKDGRDFIVENLKQDLIQRWNSEVQDYNICITMNLPAMAVEFLNTFHGLFQDEDLMHGKLKYPLVHVYCFSAKTSDNKDSVQEYVENAAGFKLSDNLEGIYFVRNVAPNKNMYRVAFYLTKDILLGKTNHKKRSNSDNETTDNKNKKIC